MTKADLQVEIKKKEKYITINNILFSIGTLITTNIEIFSETLGRFKGLKKNIQKIPQKMLSFRYTCHNKHNKFM